MTDIPLPLVLAAVRSVVDTRKLCPAEVKARRVRTAT